MFIRSIVGSVCLATFALVGCANEGSEIAQATDQAVKKGAMTEAECTKAIENKALDEALATNDTASVSSSVRLYGGEDSFADAVLVRVSDEVEPTDFLVLRSRLKGGAVEKGVCSITKVVRLAEALLPDDDKLVSGALGASCESALKAAVLKKAKAVDETASIVGVKQIYGQKSTFGGAAIVRVSDEVEPSDYIATYSVSGSQEANAGKCRVRVTELVNSGTLPTIAGLYTPRFPAPCCDS
jgi:hypothetical protein